MVFGRNQETQNRGSQMIRPSDLIDQLHQLAKDIHVVAFHDGHSASYWCGKFEAVRESYEDLENRSHKRINELERDLLKATRKLKKKNSD
jgi:hypothetical protein